MTSAISTALAGLNGAVQQFKQAAERVAGFGTGGTTPGNGTVPRDSVAVVGSRGPGGDIGALLADVNVARYSFAANARVLTIISQTQKALLDIKI